MKFLLILLIGVISCNCVLAYPSKVKCDRTGDSGKDVMTMDSIMGFPSKNVQGLIVASPSSFTSGGQMIDLTFQQLKTGGVAIHTSHGKLMDLKQEFADRQCSGPGSVISKTGAVGPTVTIPLKIPDDISNLQQIEISVLTADGKATVMKSKFALQKQAAPTCGSWTGTCPAGLRLRVKLHLKMHTKIRNLLLKMFSYKMEVMKMILNGSKWKCKRKQHSAGAFESPP